MYCHLKFQKQLQISRNVLVHANQKDVRWNKNWKIANNQLLISKCVQILKRIVKKLEFGWKKIMNKNSQLMMLKHALKSVELNLKFHRLKMLLYV